MAEHTPTPWTFHSFDKYGCTIYSPDAYPIASTDPGIGRDWIDENPLGVKGAEANARFIVDAANNHERYKAALEAITQIAGNLTDESVEAVGGVNDARSRALMVVTARQIAKNALAQKESE